MGKLSPSGDIVDPISVEMTADGNPHAGIYNYYCTTPISSSGRLGYSVRVLPGHRSLVHPHEMRLITWAEGDL